MTVRGTMLSSVALLAVFSMLPSVKAFAPPMRTQPMTTPSSSTTTRLFYMNEGDLSDADLIRQAQEARQKQQQQQQQLQDKEVENIEDFIETWEEQTFHRSKVRSCRAYMEGVSIAPDGFWTMLRLGQNSQSNNDLLDDMEESSSSKNDNSDMFMPLHVTMDPADAHATTSPESLTIIQLLSGVDMAGAILPPEVLSKVFVLECERMIQEQVSTSQAQEVDDEDEDEEEEDDEGDEDVPDVQVQEDPMILAHRILLNVQSSLPDPTMSFSETPDWAQTRAKLPQVTMDELQIIVSSADKNKPVKFQWKCQIENVGSLTIEPTNDMMGDVLYSYHPETSLTFASLALAMRYKAPMTVVLEENPKRDQQEATTTIDDDDDDHTSSSVAIMPLSSLVEKFPMYETRQNLQTKSHRVQTNIVKGFEIHKLTGALNIAIQLGDTAAAEKIRKVLDDYDSMDDLPTIPMAEDGHDNDEDGEDLDVLQ